MLRWQLSGPTLSSIHFHPQNSRGIITSLFGSLPKHILRKQLETGHGPGSPEAAPYSTGKTCPPGFSNPSRQPKLSFRPRPGREALCPSLNPFSSYPAPLPTQQQKWPPPATAATTAGCPGSQRADATSLPGHGPAVRLQAARSFCVGKQWDPQAPRLCVFTLRKGLHPTSPFSDVLQLPYHILTVFPRHS